MTTMPNTQTLPFELREPRAYAGLTVIPLFATDEAALDYVGLDEAVARGLSVSEIGEEGIVQLLLVENVVDTHVLLYEGEELVGAKSNRHLQPVRWSVPGSNRRPPACKAGALPAELTPRAAPKRSRPIVGGGLVLRLLRARGALRAGRGR